MKSSMFYYLFTIILILGSTCEDGNDDCHRKIEFYNKSEKSVYIIWATEYPDTLSYINSPNPALNPQIYKVNSNSYNDAALHIRDCWELYYGNLISSDTLMLYVFDAEVLENVPWSKITHDYLVLKRYDLSLQNLEDMDWMVTYPE